MNERIVEVLDHNKTIIKSSYNKKWKSMELGLYDSTAKICWVLSGRSLKNRVTQLQQNEQWKKINVYESHI